VYISEIRINNENVFFQKTDINIHFKHQLVLQQGSHQINITAKNLAGAEKVETLTVQINRNGPNIVITSFDQNGQVTGYIYDDSGLLSLSMDQKTVQLHKIKHDKFSFSVKINNKESKLIATDQLGNSSILIIDQMIQKAFTQLLISQNDQNNVDSDIPVSAQVFQKNKTIIFVYGWKERNRVYTDVVKIEGVVFSPNQLHALYINDKKIDKKSEKLFSFCETILLKKGENTIHITAADCHMNQVKKSLKITRETPEINKIAHRCSLYVMPINEDSLYDQENHLWDKVVSLFRSSIHSKKKLSINRQLAIDFYDQLIGKFNDHQRFRMVDKTNESDAIDTDFLIEGYIVKRKVGVEAVIHFISAKTRVTYDAFIEKNDDIQSLAERISSIIHQEFPVVKGKVVQINKSNYSVIPDSYRQLKLNWSILIFRTIETLENPVTGEFWGTDDRLIDKGEIIEIREGQFLITSEKSIQIYINDIVITQ